MPNSQNSYDDSSNEPSNNKVGNDKKGGKPENVNKKPTPKIGSQSNENAGWFGGIWNKLSLKPKNQMILPDDKNPSVRYKNSLNFFFVYLIFCSDF